jgi:prephenate dehydrogenase
MRIAFLGLGLIGGSVARALRAAPPTAGATLVAWTPSGDGPRRALAAGILDEAVADPAAALQGAGLVILAAPPLACASLVRRLGGDLRGALGPGATVTDVTSTKAGVTAAAIEAAVPFVGGHPMAGRETSGFPAADADLFRGRPWVITEAVAGGDAGAVRALALACGAVPVELDAARHDRLVASISHLPLLTSVALVEAVAGAGTAPDPEWAAAEILASNAEAVAAVLRAYRARIDAWLAVLEAPGDPDAEALRGRLAAARARLEDRA